MISEALVVSGAAILLLVIQTVNGIMSRRNDAKTAGAISGLKESIDEQVLEIRESKSVSDQLLEMHRHFDQDGTPLWYVPRSWSGTQSKIVEICQQISNTQVLLVQSMQRMEQKQNEE